VGGGWEVKSRLLPCGPIAGQIEVEIVECGSGGMVLARAQLTKRDQSRCFFCGHFLGRTAVIVSLFRTRSVRRPPRDAGVLDVIERWNELLVGLL